MEESESVMRTRKFRGKTSTRQGCSVLILMLMLMLSGCANLSNAGEPDDNLGGKNIPVSKEETTIYIASDIHYLSPRLGTTGEAYDIFVKMRDGKEGRYIDQLIDAFVDRVREDKPDMLIISGDLTVNGELYSHEDLAKKLGTIDEKVTKVYVIPGNHDINNVYARAFSGEDQLMTDYVNPEKFAEIYDKFGLSLANFGESKMLNYVVNSEMNPWVLMIDSNKYDKNKSLGYPETGGMLKEDTLQWMEQSMAEAQMAGRPLITVTHQNLFVHNPYMSQGFTIENQDKMFALMKKYGSNLNFSGHIHIQNIEQQEGVYDVVSMSLAISPHKFGVITYKDGTLDYRTEKLDVSKWAKKNGITDGNLLDYDAYTSQYFDDTMSNMERMIPAGSATEKQREEMFDLVKDLNRRYFAGEDLLEDQVTSKEAYRLIMEQEGFLGNYIKSIAFDNGVDDNALSLELVK